MLESLISRDVKQHHDEQHLAEGERASSSALAIRGDQVVTLPVLHQPGTIIETAEQGNGRIRHEGALRLCGTDGY